LSYFYLKDGSVHFRNVTFDGKVTSDILKEAIKLSILKGIYSDPIL